MRMYTFATSKVVIFNKGQLVKAWAALAATPVKLESEAIRHELIEKQKMSFGPDAPRSTLQS